MKEVAWLDSLIPSIGLGDFIPGDDPHQVGRSAYKTGVTVYLVLGLMAVMTLVNVVTNIPELDLTAYFRGKHDEVHFFSSIIIHYQHIESSCKFDKIDKSVEDIWILWNASWIFLMCILRH